MNVLLTGGAGYIGTHIAVALANADCSVTILDNFSNSDNRAVENLQKITKTPLRVIEGNILDTSLVLNVLKKYNINYVIHLAAKKSSAESISNPLDYYYNNVQGAISLLKAMKTAGIKNIIFSSSATVYGEPKYLPIDELHPTKPQNPYGDSKLYVENILRNLFNSDPEWKIVCLRYFNPVGAHDSGLIGENPNGIPNNLMPFINKVATGEMSKVIIFGNDYQTKDGTGVRDYIHVMDLASGHLAAMNIIENSKSLFDVFNLGTGKYHSVLEIINIYKECNKIDIPYYFAERRIGDIANCFADPTKAQTILGWKSKMGIEEMCLSSYQAYCISKNTN